MFRKTRRSFPFVLALMLVWASYPPVTRAQEARASTNVVAEVNPRQRPPVLEFTGSGPLTQADIEALRARGRAEGWTFEVGHNSATDRSLDDLCGLIIPPDWEPRKALGIAAAPRDTLPAFYDWRILRGTTSMKDQGACGSCWGFSAVAPVESAILIKEGVEDDLSEQWLISCTEAGGCGGGWHDSALYEFLCAEQGAVLEEDFPYEAADVACDGPYDHPYCIDDYYWVGDHYLEDVPNLKQAILDYGPISVCIGADPAFQAYLGGVFNANFTGGINHCVALVGWDDNQGTNGVWLMRNSWGPDWGEYGYMRIEYGCSFVGYVSLAVDYNPVDCNHNSVPDDQDLANCTGETWCDDCNSNGLPDGCERDCNGNGIPDDCDIGSGYSPDVNTDFLPDECETDCNGNELFDFYELQEDLDADIDRNLVPDECQDCDSDEIWDWDDLGRPNGLLVVSTGNGLVRTFYPEVGSAAGSYGVGYLTDPYDVVVGPDRRLYVSSCGDNRVVEFDALGNYVGDLNPCGTYPTGLAFGPDGNLYIASRDTNSVFRYDVTTDACLGECVAPGTGGLLAPYSLTFDSQGHMFVSSSTNNRVIEYDLTWQFVRTYSDAALLNPRGLVFHPGGDLLVASYGTTQVLRFNTETGSYLGVFASMGAGPGAVQGLAYGPNGYLYVVTYGGGVVRIYEVNGETGRSWRTFNRADPDLNEPAGLAFYPPSPEDVNQNGIPDECECLPSSAPEPDRLDLPGNPISRKVRYLSFHAGDAGQPQGIRVTFTDIPAPYTDWEGVELWVQEPQRHCENCGVKQVPEPENPPDYGCPSSGGIEPPWYWVARLGCNPHWTDWTQYNVVHVFNEGIVPSGVYDIQAIDSSCPVTEVGGYSPVLMVTQSTWADPIKDCTTVPCGPPDGITGIVDVTAILDKYKNLSGNVQEVRADIEGSPSGDFRVPDQYIGITDVTFCLGAFLGETYPPPGFEPPSAPPVCPP